MKNKAGLALIEQVIMLLILAIAAAVCIQVFTQAHLTAKQNHLQDTALLQVQNVAENIKATGNLTQTAQNLGGSMQNGVLTKNYEGFTITAEPVHSENPLLGKAKITACDGEIILTELYICWQEVGS